MANSRTVTKTLAAQEDLLFGEGLTQQKRAGGDYVVNKVRAIYPVNSLDELNDLDPLKFPKARLYLDGSVTDYYYDGTSYVIINDNIYMSLAEAQSRKLKAGLYVRLTDHENGEYKVVAIGDTGGLYKPLNASLKLRLQHNTFEIYAQHYGINTSLSDISTLHNELMAYAHGKVGEVRYGQGTFKHADTLNCSYDALKLRGAGSDRTTFQPVGDVSLAMAVNNGSWNDSTKTYSTSGTSIGSNQLKGFTISGALTTGADNDGLVLARATLGCNYGDIKITGFKGANSRGLRTYGTWYAKFYGVILENNTHNHDAGYEANDMLFSGCDWVSNPADQSFTHLTFDGGTSRTVTLMGCGFDGIPLSYGLRLRGVHNFNIYGGYMEVYNSEVSKSANFIELGNNMRGFNIDGTNLITGTGYVGTWLKCAISSSDAGRHIKFGANFQYNGDTNTCTVIDTSQSAAVEISPSARLEKGIVIENINEVVRRDLNSTYIPATTGADEIITPIFTISSNLSIPVLKIRVTAVRDGTVLAGQRIRVRIGGSVVCDYVFTSGTITAGDSFDLTDIIADGYITTTGKPAINSAYVVGTKVELWTYKVGSPQDWPDFNVEVIGL